MRISKQKYKMSQISVPIKQLYVREFVILSDYIYYSLIFEKEMGELSMLFSELSERQIEIFKMIGRLITDMGGRPALNTQIRQIYEIHGTDTIGIDAIEKIFQNEAEKKRKNIEDFTRILIISDNNSIDKRVEEIINEENDILNSFERILKS